MRSLLTSALVVTRLAAQRPGDWPVYGGGPGGMKYSPLTTIDRTGP